jgi:hypothetical protein
VNRHDTEGARPQAAGQVARQPDVWNWMFAEADDYLARPSAFSKPHRKLCLGMLEGAVRDAVQLRDSGGVRPFGVTRRNAVQTAIEADTRRLLEWIAGREDYPLSLRNVCEVLELDESWIRGGLFKLVGGRPGALRKRGESVIRRTYS